MQNFNLPALGGGAGLRHKHFRDIAEKKPPFSWFEIITEDFINPGTYTTEYFDKIRQDYTIVCHGVSLSVGSTDPLNREYLKKLKDFSRKIGSPYVSDHLCYTMVDHVNFENLIPLPFTMECAKHCIERIKIIQDTLEKPFLVENVTRYVTVSDREMSEAEFITTVVEGANCGLLLDVTNAYLNGHYHKFEPIEFIESLPLERVGTIHLAGWEELADGTFIDTHDAPVPPQVLDLFRNVIKLTGPTSVLVEWDDRIPPIERLLKEAQQAERIMNEVSMGMAA